MSRDEELDPWVFDFADRVAVLTVRMLKPGWPAELIHPSLDMIHEAAHEAVLTCLHDSPINSGSNEE